MATKKPTSKKKTAPAKASARVTAKTGSAPAKIKKTTSKPVTPDKHEKHIKVKDSGIRAQISKLQKLLAIVPLALAVAAGLLMREAPEQVRMPHVAPDAFGEQALVPASRLLADLSIRNLLIAGLLVSALFMLVTLTKYKQRYEHDLQERIAPLRWVGIAVVSAVFLTILALLTGVHDAVSLKLLAMLAVTASLLGWVAERANKKSEQPEWLILVLAAACGLLPLLLLLGVAGASWVYGGAVLPWYVYALHAVALVGFAAFVRNAVRHQRGWGYIDYERIERNYLAIGLLGKVAFAVILIVGLLR